VRQKYRSCNKAHLFTSCLSNHMML
jgi:hypothetical protein